jgi:hypothetical protein
MGDGLMKTMTIDELTENLQKNPNWLECRKEEIAVFQNNRRVARIIPEAALPEPVRLSAREVMADLYQTLSNEAGEDWTRESRMAGTLKEQLRDPWDSWSTMGQKR